MDANDLAALLRADPERGARAIEAAKIAGPWRRLPSGQWVRDCWSAQAARPEGLRVAAYGEAQVAHDAALRGDGWKLA